MAGRVLVAGIGNIFQGDDAFGVAVVQRLSAIHLPEHVRVMDAGIRALDLVFALLDDYELAILVDATSRGGAPGTLYTIEIDVSDIPDACDESLDVNSHALDPVRVLTLAKSMGARFRRLTLIGCEPLTTDCDDTGQIGLSEIVEAAVNPAVERVRELIEHFKDETSTQNIEEVYP
jgi:hydrogenase maturation protease